MPAETRKQYRLMQLVAHNPEAARRLGIPPSVAEEFIEKTPARLRSLWSRGKRTLSQLRRAQAHRKQKR